MGRIALEVGYRDAFHSISAGTLFFHLMKDREWTNIPVSLKTTAVRSSGLGRGVDLCRERQQLSSDGDDRTCHCGCVLSVIELYSSHTADLNLHLAGKNERPVFALLLLFHGEEV